MLFLLSMVNRICLYIYLLHRNPTYVLLSLAGASEAMLIAGFTTFLPKIIENQFQQTAGTAALVAGLFVLIVFFSLFFN